MKLEVKNFDRKIDGGLEFMTEDANSRNVSVIKDVNGNNIVMINDIIFKGRQAINWKM